MSTELIEKEIGEIWGEALGLDAVSPDDDFFELGGDSITAIRILPEISDRFGVEPAVGVIFDNPTLRELTKALVELGATTN